MGIVVPTIMAETLDQLQTSVQNYQTFARRVHIDISDGEFTPTFLLNETQLYWPEGWEVDIHAMVARPSEHIPQLIAMRPSMVILHAETSEDLMPHIAALREAGIKPGLALLKTTVPSTVENLIQAVDHVMVFSGELGHFGGTASMMQLEKVRLIKKIKPDVEIGWDGGVNIENAYTLTQGGVDVLNAGGVIATAESPATVYQELVKEINKRGVI